MQKKSQFFTMAALVLTMAVIAPTGTIQGQGRDVSQREIRHSFTLGGEITNFSKGEKGWGANLGYNQCLKGVWWLGAEATFATTPFATLGTTDTAPGNGFVGLNVKFGPRLELGPVYIQPNLLLGAGMVAQNRIITKYAVQQSLPFLALQAGGELELGFSLGPVALGVYAAYMQQFAEIQPVRGIKADAEWLTANPFSIGARLAILVDKGKGHKGGNNVPLLEPWVAYGTYGFETGARLIFTRNTGLPWMRKNEEGLRKEHIFSQQYGVRFGETLGDINRTTAQVGYGLQYHPKGSLSPLIFTGFLWAGMGEGFHGAEVTSSATYNFQSKGEYLQTGFKANLELMLTWRPFGCKSKKDAQSSQKDGKTIGRRIGFDFFVSPSWTHVSGSKTECQTLSIEESFASGWGISAGLGVTISL